MRRPYAPLLLVVIALLALGGWKSIQGTKLDDAGLKAMLTGLGYEVKESSATVFDIPVTSSGLNIPTRLFLAKSKTKIWMSVALLNKETTETLTREDLHKLLEKTVDVGPCHFMIEGGWLKMKMAIDNRDVTPAILRSELDYLVARVVSTKDVWQKKP